MKLPFVLAFAIPGGRRRTARCLSVPHAVALLRATARRLGVSPRALDWSVERVVRPAV